MDDIDQNCWILEPEHPTRADASRRIALGENFGIRFYQPSVFGAYWLLV